MKIASFNACGLVGKAEEIMDFTRQNKINLVIVLETHFKSFDSSIFTRPLCDQRKEVAFGPRSRGAS